MKTVSALVIACLAISSVASADTTGDALLQKCIEAEGRIKAMEANFTLRQESAAGSRALRGSLKVQKPNRALITMQGGQTSDARTLASDGKQFTTFYTADNEFQREAADPSGGNVGRAATTEVTVFFNPDVLNQMRAQGKGIKVVGSSVIGGVKCKELKITGTAEGSTYRLFLGPDMLLRGVSLAYQTPTGPFAIDSRITDLKTPTTVAGNAFAFALPKGAKPYQEKTAAAAGPSSSGTSADDSGLLAIGAMAPDFQLPLLDGGKLTLSAITKANKATLLCFWNNAFAGCREELPALNKVLQEFRGKGFAVVTVNSGDDLATVGKLWKSASLELLAAINGDKVADKYHVTAVPTNYLIGGNGKIMARFEGFDEAAIRASLPKSGVK